MTLTTTSALRDGILGLIGNVLKISAGEQIGRLGTDWLISALRDPSDQLNSAVSRALTNTWDCVRRGVRGPGWLDSLSVTKKRRGVSDIIARLLKDNPARRDGCRSELIVAEREVFGRGWATADSGLTGDDRFEIPAGGWTGLDLVRANREALAAVADGLSEAGMPHLGWLLSRPAADGGVPLLLATFTCCFREQVDADERLSRCFAADRLDAIAVKIDTMFEDFVARATPPPAPEPIRAAPRALPEFDAARDAAARLYGQFERLSEHVAGLIEPHTRNDRLPRYAERARAQLADIERLRAALGPAFAAFDLALAAPLVRLVLIGTTSSGKSTVTNTTAGGFLMPVAVGEMSAGMVRIVHSHDRRLVLRDTPGLEQLLTRPDEWTRTPEGDWAADVPCDARVRELLEPLMGRYNRLRQDNAEPECPQAHLYYPVRLVTRNVLELPDVCRVELLDLAGLNHINDERNRAVIRDYARNALCLVLYNAAEPDREKKKNLLREVAEQVKKLGASPARMLFALNRVDVFRNDRDPERSLAEFRDETARSIREHLTEKLPQYKRAIEKIDPILLSSEAAFYAQAARERSEERAHALQELADRYRKLFPKELGRLAGGSEFWSAAEGDRVAAALWEASHGAGLYKALRDHVHTHLPELAIPPAANRLRLDGADEALQWLERTASAERNGCGNRYLAEVERLDRAEAELRGLHARFARELARPFREIEGRFAAFADEATDRLLAVTQELLVAARADAPYSDLPDGALAPLWGWRDSLGEPVKRILADIQRCLLAGTDLDGEAIRDLIGGDGTRGKLIAVVRAMQAAGYTAEVARDGGAFDVRTDADRARVESFRIALRSLADHLEAALADAVSAAAAGEMHWVQNALDALFAAHRRHVLAESQACATRNHLALRLELADPSLERVHRPVAPGYGLGGDVATGTRQERVQTGTERVQTGTTQVTERRRRWGAVLRWALGEYETVTTTKPVMEDRPTYRFDTVRTASYPAAADLLQGWRGATEARDPELVRNFVGWLLSQAEATSAALDTYQQALLKQYREELGRVNELALERSEQEEREWAAAIEVVAAFADEYRAFVTSTHASEERA